MSISYTPKPIEGTVKDIAPVTIQMVRQTSLEPLWDELVRRYHYLGHRRMPGANLKYLAFTQGIPLAALSFRAASIKLKPRDCYIGWSDKQKSSHLLQLANNNRFLILPGVHVKNLGSHLLSRITSHLLRDWYQFYNQELLLLETYVDPRWYQGTVYKAAGWVHIGSTLGFTKKGPAYIYHGHSKEVFCYPLRADFRQVIGCIQRPFLQRPSHKSYLERSRFKMMLTHNDWDPNLTATLDITPEEVCKLAEELYTFHQQFLPCFRREEQRAISLAYLKGLASDLEAKSAEPIALRYLDEKGVRNTQHFLTAAKWDTEKLLAEHQLRLAEIISAEEGMFTLDSSEVPKKGNDSAGVARQYCGRLGKIENCQSGVFLGYASDKGYGLLQGQLYVPEIWFTDEYAERRAKCHFPQGLTFKTKHQIAFELLQKAEASGAFTGKWVGVDSFFGSNPEFLEAVGEKYYYFADIHSNILVWPERPQIGLPPYKGRGPYPQKEKPLTDPVPVSEIAKEPFLPWQTVSIAEGAKGPIIAEVARLRVIEKRDGLPGQECWLFLRKNTDGQIKYGLCNAPEDISMEEMVQMSAKRWSIEQLFQEGKSYLGMDHYEVRSYTGWHRHMALVFLIMHFLLSVRLAFGQKKHLNPPTSQTPATGRSS